MRLSVETILSLLAQGASSEEILDDYPRLEPDDIRACIAYAHAVIAGDNAGCGLGGEAVKFLVDCCAGRRLAEWLRNEGTTSSTLEKSNTIQAARHYWQERQRKAES